MVRLLLTLALIHGWYTHQIDFILAFPQADTNTTLYMELPKQYKVYEGALRCNDATTKPSNQPHVLKLEKTYMASRTVALLGSTT
jgi:hypothetical protein